MAMMMKACALFVLALNLVSPVGVATKRSKAAVLDQVSLVPWAQRFQAAEHTEELQAYVDSWQGPSDLQCLDLFGRSQAIAKQFRKRGYRALAWDVALDSAMDITTSAGFINLLCCGLRCMDNAFVPAGPPCSMWIFLSSSCHKRHSLGVFGDPCNLATQTANLIVENLAAFLGLLRRRRRVWTLIEQPGSSLMFNMPCLQLLAALIQPVILFTWLGCWGHKMCKPTRLWSDLPKVTDMARKMTKKQRESIKKKQLAEEARRKRKGLKAKPYYIKHKNGSVSGCKELAKSAEYPAKFAAALFALWHSAWKMYR